MKTRRIIQTGVYISLATMMLTISGCKNRGQKRVEMDRETEMEFYFNGAEEVNAGGILDLQRATPDNLITFNIDFPKYDESSRNGEELSNFAEILSIIPLETTKECLIGKIDKILHVDGIYYIVDSRKAKGIFAFDGNGKFITCIGGAGRGPGEYVEPTDIFYDSEKGELVVWDQYQHQFTRFTKDGKFLGDKKVSLRLDLCTYDDESGLLWCAAMSNKSLGPIANYQLFALDSTYNNIRYRTDYNPLELNFTRTGNIQKSNFSLYYHPQLSDTIYEIKGGDITPRFALNYGNVQTLPDNFREECKGDYEIFMEKYKTFAQLRDPFCVTDKCIIANLMYEYQNRLAICDIEKQYVRFINTRTFIDGTPTLYSCISRQITNPSGMIIEGNQITISVSLSELIKSNNKENPYEELSPYISTQPKDDDNPLLIIVKFLC